MSPLKKVSAWLFIAISLPFIAVCLPFFAVWCVVIAARQQVRRIRHEAMRKELYGRR